MRKYFLNLGVQKFGGNTSLNQILDTSHNQVKQVFIP